MFDYYLLENILKIFYISLCFITSDKLYLTFDAVVNLFHNHQMLCLATEGYVMSNDMLSPQLHINAYIVCHGFG